MRRPDGGIALVPYLMAGDPDDRTTRELGKRFAAAGVGAIELGVPYSDPLADGPVIQRAGRRALDAGATVETCLETAADIAAEQGAPVVLMTYVNPVLHYGPERFAADAAQAGVAGVIVPDLPVEEAAPVAPALRAAGLDTVFLVAPTSSAPRVAAACAASTGFVYCVTVTGITGSRSALPADVTGLLDRVRAATALPVAAGFGISRPDQLTALRGHADAAVVGSAIVGRIEQGDDPSALVKELLSACR
ncbi:tryptophan synthase subunit alpha [Amycolatopsis sp. 195334CR]|uniref:tryptophan synthase subunit alpha n=1 Tax=Amycolatopsis sp. 195334CR TaxID=2814588 RepID=UPI001A8C4910|nr:tryptophan synthase subunit alpha [Amycolatopsis sp. 195334CR]MBN6039777.1 tryptophan synthase subunit alpha [Amycolatopsis sp. 195334CR]